MGDKSMKVGDKSIGKGQPVFTIAEVGINHDGCMRKAEQLLKEAANAGADSVKLQTYITDKRVPKDSPVYEVLKKCELTFSQQQELFLMGKELDILVFSTPFDEESVDFLEEVSTPLYKIASFDSVNLNLLEKIGQTNKPIIMSTGMTNLDELKLAWSSLGGREDGTGCELALLHCISSYPMNPEDANLSVITKLHKLHGGPVGYSDHSIGIEVPSLAVAAGAQIIEKHFTYDVNADGPDHALSADPKTLFEMIKKIRDVETIMGSDWMGVRDSEKSIVPFRRKTSKTVALA